MINGFIKSVHKTLITGIRIHSFCGKSICNLRNRRSFRFCMPTKTNANINNMKTNQRFIAKSYSFYESSFYWVQMKYKYVIFQNIRVFFTIINIILKKS